MKANKIRLYAAIGKTLRNHREARKVSRDKLALAIGMSSSQLGKIEEGIQPCPIYALVVAAEMFDLTLDELVPVLTDTEVAA